MHFIVHCFDKPGRGQLRTDTRPTHVDYLTAHRSQILTAGPTHEDEGEGFNGSLLIVDFPDRAAVDAFVANDPYTQAGLFEKVVIQPWKMTFAPQ